MDYEKKYNEAFEKARRLYEGKDKAPEEPILEYLFPELRESEDERIRKYLVEELKAAKSVGELKFTIPQPTREECIDYLEKQKEQKPAWGEDDNKMLAGTLNSLKRYQLSMPNYQVELQMRWLKSIRPQPKQEWGEEDEKMRNLAIEWAETMSGQISFVDMDPTDFRKIIAWLKSLRPSWKPSEEQMDALKELIDDANRAGWVTPGATELYEQLKKL